MDNNNNQTCMIHEQGDLGCFAVPINEEVDTTKEAGNESKEETWRIKMAYMLYIIHRGLGL